MTLTCTSDISSSEDLIGYDAIWVVLAVHIGTWKALIAIRYAFVKTSIPFLGTCGGFQHAISGVYPQRAGLE